MPAWKFSIEHIVRRIIIFPVIQITLHQVCILSLLSAERLSDSTYSYEPHLKDLENGAQIFAFQRTTPFL